jgi:hypothetical protein
MIYDLALSRGKLTMVEKKLSSDYSIKFKELVESLEGRVSENQVRDMVSAEIVRLQKGHDDQEKEALDLEVKTRAETISLTKARPDFQLDYKIDIQGHPGFSEMTYIESADVLVFDGIILDLKTQKKRLQGFSRHKILNDETILWIEEDGRIQTYDIGKDQTQLRATMKFVEDSRTSISESGKWIAMYDYNKIEFIESKTGQKSSVSFKNPLAIGVFGRLRGKKESNIHQTYFLSDSEVLINVDGSTYYKFNFLTGTTTPIDLGGFRLRDLEINPKDGSLMLVSIRELAAIQASDLVNFKSKARILKVEDGDLYRYKFTPDGENIYIQTYQTFQHAAHSTTTWKFGFVSSQDLISTPEQYLPLQNRIGITAGTPAFDLKGGRLFIGSYHRDSANKEIYQLEVWKEKREK